MGPLLAGILVLISATLYARRLRTTIPEESVRRVKWLQMGASVPAKDYHAAARGPYRRVRV